MPTVLLVRHGRSLANAANILAGRAPDNTLDDTGRAQADALVERLAAVPLSAVVSSPLERCVQTIEPLLSARDGLAVRPRAAVLALELEDRLLECDYGEWTGQGLGALSKTPLWRTIQAHPSGVRFPGGESMREMQHRAVSAVTERDAAVETAYGTDAFWLAVSHGDVIKSIVADALGLHLDDFQRIAVDTASVTVIRYTPMRTFVLHLNDRGSLAHLRPPEKKRRRRTKAESDAVVGGTTG